MSQNNMQALLQEGTRLLQKAGIEEARLESRLFLEEATGLSREALLLQEQEAVLPEVEEKFFSYIKRRAKKEPAQYIIGRCWFWGLPFSVTKDVLIPRPDTELLVEEALAIHQKEPVAALLDLCTGSGCIPISLLKEGVSEATLTDISPKALAVAEENAKRLGVSQRAICLQSDLFSACPPKRYDMITANPPYINQADMAELMADVKEYEPHLALYGGVDGLDFYRRIVPQSRDYLKMGGHLLLEIGYDQGKAVSDLMKEAGFSAVEVRQDLAGLDRVVRGCWMGQEGKEEPYV